MTWSLVVAAATVALAVALWPSSDRPPARPPGRGQPPAAAPTTEQAADALVLLAAALRSGCAPVEALEVVAGLGIPASGDLRVVAAALRWGDPALVAWARVGPGWRPAAVAWHAADVGGGAPASLLSAAATRMREEEVRRVEQGLARAGVLLVLPLGLCFLPGFIGTCVVPVVLHLAGGWLD